MPRNLHIKFPPADSGQPEAAPEAPPPDGAASLLIDAVLIVGWLVTFGWLLIVGVA